MAQRVSKISIRWGGVVAWRNGVRGRGDVGKGGAMGERRVG